MHEPVVDELIENALDYLLKASEYAREGTPRSAKYSLIFLGTSLEILLKARLFREHWSLIFANVDKADSEALVTGGFKSADYDTVLNRLTGICSVQIEEKALSDLRRLRRLRNMAVHFTLQVNAEQINSLLAKGCDFVMEFGQTSLADEVDLNSPMMAKITENLREFDHFVKERLKTIEPLLKGAAELLECDRCWQLTLSLGDGNPHCLFCGYEVDAEELARQKSEGVVQNCPHCGEEACALIVVNNDQALWRCMACGEGEETAEYNTCPRCGRLTNNDGACDDCWAELMEKD